MEKSQAESGVCGVGPAESTGKPRSRYCPGGSLPLVSPGFRRPRNPREMNPSLIVLPPAHLPGESWLFAGETRRGENALIPVREPSRRHYTGSETIIRLCTSVTPEAEQAVSSAAFFSA